MVIRVALDASPTTDGRRYAGIGRYVAELIDALRRLEGQVELHLAAPCGTARSDRWPYRWVRGQLPIARTVCRTRPHLVHALASEATLCFPLDRQVVMVHDTVPWTGPSRSLGPTRAYLELQRRLLPRVGAVIVPSQPVIADVTRELDVPRDRIIAIPHGISPVFSPEPRAEDVAALARVGIRWSPYLLWVGSLYGPDPRKGLDVLFDAVRSIEPASRPLVVLAGRTGEGSDWARRRAARDGIDLDLPGYVEDADLSALYRRAAVVVVPSRHEGFGLPALEAMACGAPLVVTDAGSLPSVVDDAAAVVPGDDAAALAEAVRGLLADTVLQDRLRTRGPRRAASFSWETAARQTAEVYEKLVSSRGYSPPVSGPISG